MSIDALNPTTHGLKFGKTIVMDIGASKPGASCKIRVLDGQDRDAFVSKDNTEVCAGGIKSAEEFIQRLTARARSAYESSGLKDPIENIVLFVPSQPKDGVVKAFSGFKLPNGELLKDVDFNLISKELEDGTPIKLLAGNDMLGVTSGLISALKQHPIYSKILDKDGATIGVGMVGGGFGVSQFRRVGEQLQLEGTECGHLKSANGPGTVQDEAVSVPAMIRNYAKHLNLSDAQTKSLVAAGNAQVLTEYPVSPKTDEECAKLLATGLFNRSNVSKNKLVLKGISQQEHEEAVVKTIDQLCAGLAQVAQVNALQGADAMILTGPLLTYTRKDMQGHLKPLLQKHYDFDLGDDPLKAIVWNKLVGIQSESSRIHMKDIVGFQLITDIHLPDNTVGGGIFKDAESVEGCSYRFRVPN